MAEGRFTAVALRHLTKPGFHADGQGLYLRIGDGRKGWLFRYKRAGKSHWLGLGSASDVTLAQARQAARECRAQLRAGVDPLEARRAAAAERAEAGERTFRAIAGLYIEAHKAGWKNAKHAAQWSATLAGLAYPVIGDRPVAAITVADVLRVLQPHWTRVPETASRLRGRIEQILDFARARGWRQGENPARWKGGLQGLLPPSGRVARVKHQPALPWKQVPVFVHAIRDVHGIAPRVLEFAVLTASRSGEARGMTWGEVDFAEALWTIAGERMKAKKQHRVPLSDPALAILRGLLPESEATAAVPQVRRDALVFPGGKPGQPLSDMAVSLVIRRLNGETDPPAWRDASGRAVVPHGFRSTFRDWCSEAAGVAREISEAALAHVNADRVEAAYARSDHLDQRRALMARWGAFATAAPAKVLPMSARKV